MYSVLPARPLYRYLHVIPYADSTLKSNTLSSLFILFSNRRKFPAEEAARQTRGLRVPCRLDSHPRHRPSVQGVREGGRVCGDTRHAWRKHRTVRKAGLVLTCRGAWRWQRQANVRTEWHTVAVVHGYPPALPLMCTDTLART